MQTGRDWDTRRDYALTTPVEGWFVDGLTLQEAARPEMLARGTRFFVDTDAPYPARVLISSFSERTGGGWWYRVELAALRAATGTLRA